MTVRNEHRVVHSEEHDPGAGMLDGYCALCGVPFPCEAEQELQAARLAAIRSTTTPNRPDDDDPEIQDAMDNHGQDEPTEGKDGGPRFYTEGRYVCDRVQIPIRPKMLAANEWEARAFAQTANELAATPQPAQLGGSEGPGLRCEISGLAIDRDDEGVAQRVYVEVGFDVEDGAIPMLRIGQSADLALDLPEVAAANPPASTGGGDGLVAVMLPRDFVETRADDEIVTIGVDGDTLDEACRQALATQTPEGSGE